MDNGFIEGGLAFLLSLTAVRGMITYTRKHAILDLPTSRSSHTAPVPRGGGLGLLCGFLFVSAVQIMRFGPATALFPLAAACLVGGIGWLDDRRGLSVRARFIVHVGAGLTLGVYAHRLGFSVLWSAWWVFCAVSAINVVNFLDGIDGFVASQCLVLCGTLVILAPAGSLGFGLACILGGALVGFLCWNWPPAKIFMGDVGSGALGYLCVLIGAVVMSETDASLVRVFLPLVPMVLDSTWTMLRRQRNGERLTEAHRSHLYQRLANGGWTHRSVTILYSGAAAGGALVAVVHTSRWWMVAASYVAGVIGAGAVLDRTRPFVWTRPVARG